VWQPILDGELRREALRCAAGIAEDLITHLPHTDDDTLGIDSAMMAIYYHYHAQSLPGHLNDLPIRTLLDTSMTALETRPMLPSLHGGFVGIVWAMAHLSEYWMQPGSEDPLTDIDEALLEALTTGPWDGDYDLINGLAGIGVYALERLPGKAAAAIVAAIVRQLEDRCESSAAGITWFSAPELMRGTALQETPLGAYNLGLAHGIPGVIGFLGSAMAAGIEAERTARLLQGSVAWLLSQRQPEHAPSRFYRSIGPGIEPVSARTGWCYGDPGVAIVLENAAKLIGVPAWSIEARAIARSAAGRSLTDSGVVDACLCHGAAGIAQIFNRMQHSSRDPVLAAAARRWVVELIAMRRIGERYGGFPMRVFGEEGQPGWEANADLLGGAAGVALTLLAAATDVEPHWDRIFLLSSAVSRL
jgi:lantibiotic biosynthesis protein